MSVDETRWEEKAGLRRDAIGSQVIDALEATEIKETGNEKISTAAARPTKDFPDRKLTIGLDLGDRSRWYCGLDEAGEVLLVTVI